MLGRNRLMFKYRGPFWLGLLLLCSALALVPRLFVTFLDTAMVYGFEQYGLACQTEVRVQRRFEELLFLQGNAVGMVGPDGKPFGGLKGGVPIAAEIAACFPEQVVGDKLLLPADVSAYDFQDAVMGAFKVAQGSPNELDQEHAHFYPMNTSAAPCVLAATQRLHRQAEASTPPRDPKCRGLGLRYVAQWLLIGWGPILAVLTIFLGVRWYFGRRQGGFD